MSRDALLVADLIQAAASFYHVEPEQLLRPGRADTRLHHARRAVFRTLRLGGWSLHAIARAFRGNHGTIQHGLKLATRQVAAADHRFNDCMAILCRRLIADLAA